MHVYHYVVHEWNRKCTHSRILRPIFACTNNEKVLPHHTYVISISEVSLETSI